MASTTAGKSWQSHFRASWQTHTKERDSRSDQPPGAQLRPTQHQGMQFTSWMGRIHLADHGFRAIRGAKGCHGLDAQKPNLGLRRPSAHVNNTAKHTYVVPAELSRRDEPELPQTARDAHTDELLGVHTPCTGASGGWASLARMCGLLSSRQRVGWVLACMGELPRRKTAASRASPNFWAGVLGIRRAHLQQDEVARELVVHESS